jgi:hypothetical protein
VRKNEGGVREGTLVHGQKSRGQRFFGRCFRFVFFLQPSSNDSSLSLFFLEIFPPLLAPIFPSLFIEKESFSQMLG